MMRAAVIDAFGRPPSITEVDEPELDPSTDHVLAEVVAAGLNPVDLHVAGGSFYAMRPKPPYTPGLEGVARLSNDRLVYFGRPADLRRGAFAQRLPIDPAAAFELPSGTDPASAIACGIAGLAGWMSVVGRGQLQAGETVVVTGATGVAGRVAVQAARLAGARQIVAIGRDEAGLARARELGATDVVRWTGPMFLHHRELEALTGGHDLVVDFTWGPPAMAALLSSAPFARLVQVGNAAAPGLGVSAADLRARQLDLLGFSVFNEPLERRRDAFNTLLAHVAAGRVVIDTERVSLDDLPLAWDRQRASPGTKLVVEIG